MENTGIPNPVGRPTKLNKTFIDALTSVINSSENSFILTDEELLFCTNEKLREQGLNECMITSRTWQRWVAKEEELEIDIAINYEELDNTLQEFCRLIKKARTTQKLALATNIRKGEGAWQSNAWISERKFEDLNLRQNINQKLDGKLELTDSKQIIDAITNRSKAVRQEVENAQPIQDSRQE